MKAFYTSQILENPTFIYHIWSVLIDLICDKAQLHHFFQFSLPSNSHTCSTFRASVTFLAVGKTFELTRMIWWWLKRRGISAVNASYTLIKAMPWSRMMDKLSAMGRSSWICHASNTLTSQCFFFSWSTKSSSIFWILYSVFLYKSKDAAGQSNMSRMPLAHVQNPERNLWQISTLQKWMCAHTGMHTYTHT